MWAQYSLVVSKLILNPPSTIRTNPYGTLIKNADQRKIFERICSISRMV
jgi:hypothetical protein